MDVRNLSGRVLFGAVVLSCGILGATVVLGFRVGRHWLRGSYAMAVAPIGFLVCGAVGGIVYEIVRRRLAARVRSASLPRAVARVRARLT